MTNSTALAYAVIDAQIDYNMKLLTMFIVFSFAIIGFYIGKNKSIDSWGDIILVLMSKIMFYPTIIFIPLYIFLLHREFAFVTMWTWLLVAYSVVWFVLFLVLLVKGFEFIFKMVGLDMGYQAWNDNRLTKKENEGLL